MDNTVLGILQAGILEWVAVPFSRGTYPRVEPGSPALQVDSLPADSLPTREAPGAKQTTYGLATFLFSVL